MGSRVTTSTLSDPSLGPSLLTVRSLIAAVHIGLVVSVVLLVALRLLGLRIGLVAQSSLIVVTLFTAVLLGRWWGRDGRE